MLQISELSPSSFVRPPPGVRVELAAGDRLLSECGAGAVANCSVRTLQAHRSAGTGPEFLRLKRRVAYRLSAVLAWRDGASARG